MPAMNYVRERFSLFSQTRPAMALSSVYHSAPSQFTIHFFEDTISQLLAAGKFLWNSPDVNQYFQESLDEGLTGLKRSARWLTLYRVIRKNSVLQKKLTDSFIFNIFLYAGPIIAYEWINHGLRKFDAENSILENTSHYQEFLVSCALFVGALLINFSHNTIITAEITKNAPKISSYKCPHAITEQMKGDVESTLAFTRNLAYAKSFLWFGGYSGKLLASLAFGQMLMDAKLVGMCTEDRAKIFRSNNTFIAAFGLSCMVVTALLTMMLTRITPTPDTENKFLEDAALSFSFQLFMMMSILQDKPLPGKKRGLDLFKYNRVQVSAMLSDATQFTAQQIFDPAARDFFTTVIFAILNFPPMKLAAFFLLGVGLFPIQFYRNPFALPLFKKLTLETALKIPEFNDLVLLQENTIVTGARIMPYMRSASLLGSFIPTFLITDKMGHLIKAVNALAKLDEKTLGRVTAFLEQAKYYHEFSAEESQGLLTTPQIAIQEEHYPSEKPPIKEEIDKNRGWVIASNCISPASAALQRLGVFPVINTTDLEGDLVSVQTPKPARFSPQV